MKVISLGSPVIHIRRVAVQYWISSPGYIGAPVRASRPLYLATIVFTIFSPFTLVLPDQLSAHGHIMAMY